MIDYMPAWQSIYDFFRSQSPSGSIAERNVNDNIGTAFLYRMPFSEGITLYYMLAGPRDRANLVWDGGRVSFTFNYSKDVPRRDALQIRGSERNLVEARLRGIF